MEAAVKYINETNRDRQNEPLISLSQYDARNRNAGDALTEILKQGDITTVFQPIVSLKDGSILGYEALSRGPKNSVLANPGELFETARACGKLWELEFLCRNKALENAAKNGLSCNLFINVDPTVLMDERFRKGFTGESLKKYGFNPERIVIEVTESSSIDDTGCFKDFIEHYKQQGFKIAIDDAGAGYSGLNLITGIHPHFIKLDMNLIRDLDRDSLKYSLIKAFYEFSLVTDIKLIAEGVETKNELNSLMNIGISYVQGYLIQKPSREITEIDEKILALIKGQNSKKNTLYYTKPSAVAIEEITRSHMTVGPELTGADLLEIFDGNPSVYGLPVVSGGKLAGLIMKDKFYMKIGTRYGYAVFHKRHIHLLMDKHPLSVDCKTTIDVVSKSAMTRGGENIYDYIIVTKDSDYYGVVTVKDLLEKTTELEINYAKHLNPLSGLPGNLLIEQKLKSLIGGTSPFTVLYVDIDNFKVYNDIYGFECGDRMIQFLGRAIDKAVTEHSRDAFIGHIGGDDFVVAVESYETDELCSLIIALFEKGIRDFYTEQDFERKYITARNRHGIEEQFGIATLSIAGISNRNRSFKDVFELSEQASRLKEKCKEIWKSCYCID